MWYTSGDLYLILWVANFREKNISRSNDPRTRTILGLGSSILHACKGGKDNVLSI